MYNTNDGNNLNDILEIYFNIIHKINIMKEPQQSTCSFPDFEIHKKYVEYLKNEINLNKEIDRIIFADISVSLFEVLIKKTIKEKINNHLHIAKFKDEWLTLIIKSKPDLKEYGEEIEHNKIPEDLGDYVANVYGYNSEKALNFSSGNFALAYEFAFPAYEIREDHMIFDDIKLEKKTILEMIFDFYKLRNKTTHSLDDYPAEKALSIQMNLEKIIEIITGIFSQSLEIRRLNVDDNELQNHTFKQLRKKIIEEQIRCCESSKQELNKEHGEFRVPFHKYPNTKKQLITQLENIIKKLNETKGNLHNA